MEISLDKLIKWILTQYDDSMTDEQKRDILRGILHKGKEENDGQGRDSYADCTGTVGRQSGV